MVKFSVAIQLVELLYFYKNFCKYNKNSAGSK